MRVWPGQPHPLGAHWDGRGTNFALACAGATAVRLCLFDDVEGSKATHEIPLGHHTHGVWHAYLPDVRPGQLYGYRVRRAPGCPHEGHALQPRQAAGRPLRARAGRRRRLGRRRSSQPPGAATGPTPRQRAAACRAAWWSIRPFRGATTAPRVRRGTARVIYECHVKGMTAAASRRARGPARHATSGSPRSPCSTTCASLGVTAVELLPVHHARLRAGARPSAASPTTGATTRSASSRRTRASPSSDRGEQVTEFKTMVQALHRAGIEVLLDVVYNHTAEGGPDGPTFCWRGIDDRTSTTGDAHDHPAATPTTRAAATP